MKILTTCFAFLLSFPVFAATTPCNSSDAFSECQVQYLCAEVQPILMPIQVEIWNQPGLVTLHEYAGSWDGNRTEIASARVQVLQQKEHIEFVSSGPHRFDLSIDPQDGIGILTESILGKTLITTMFCGQPLHRADL